MASLELTKQTEMAVAGMASQSRAYLEKTLPNAKLDTLVQDVRMAISKSVNVSKGTTLAECTPESLIGCMINAGSMGVSLNPDSKQAYLIPYRCGGVNVAQLNVSYIGLRNMIAQRTGMKMRAVCVYSHEPLEFYSDGFEQQFKHTPLPESTRGEFLYVFSLAKDLDGDISYERMTAEDIESCRKASKSGNSEYGPWAKWPEEMRKKSVTRRHIKNLPTVPRDVAQAIANDEAVDIGRPQEMTEAYANAGIKVEPPVTPQTDEDTESAFDSVFANTNENETTEKEEN